MLGNVKGASNVVPINSSAAGSQVQEAPVQFGSEALEPVKQMPAKESVEKTISSMNEFLKASNTRLKFVLHDKLHEYYVTVVDDVTEEVVKEIPPKKLLDMYASMTELLGLLVDKKI